MKPAEVNVWQAREKLVDDAVSRDALVFKATMLPGEIAAVQKRLAAWPGETICLTHATGIMTAAILSGTLQFAILIDELRATASIDRRIGRCSTHAAGFQSEA